MDVINPANGEVIDSYNEYTEQEVSDCIERAENRYEDWSDRSLQYREKLLSNASDVLRDNKQRYAEIMTKEMGKPVTQAVSEVEKCAWVCDHYSKNAGQYLNDKVYPSPPGTDVRTEYEPLGCVLAVMPWNFPFWQVFRFAAPYTTVGNVGLLKHASNVPRCAMAIQEVFEKAGYPEGVFQSLLIGSDKVDRIIEEDFVKAVTLTGSEPAGSAVAKKAGNNIKKSVLELGGSDPYIILENADLEEAAEIGSIARNQNNGQSCIAAKRFIVVEDVYEEFLTKLAKEFENLEIGEPMNEEVDIGPQADEDLMMSMHNQVEESIDRGANVYMGGSPMDREGHYYPPTILTNIPQGCPADQEEIFGPVASVYKVDGVEEAISKSNDTRFGLGASVWTENIDLGRHVASQIESGCVYINEMVKSDPRVPFGGIGISGFGRELSEVGIKEFTNKKTIWTKR